MKAASLFEDTNPHELKELLGQIQTRELALPDFQRDFVWDPGATQELIISIANGFPAGSILRIRNTHNLFAAREFEGAPSLNGKRATYLVLDGQQRLTSLYQAFYGCGEHRFFVDLKLLMETGDFEDSIFHLRSEHRRIRQLGQVETQAASLVLPLSVIFGQKGGFIGWVMHVSDSIADAARSKKVREQLMNAGEWVTAIDDYKFPVVTLSELTKPEAVCTIFETLNRTGVKLSVFELLTARFWAEELNLRALWDQAQQDHPIIGRFDLDPYYLLQIAALLREDAAPSCKRSDVLRLKSDHVRRVWDDVVWGVQEALTILRDDCGVWLPQWLPYTALLVPMGAILAKQRALKGPGVAAARQKVVRWFWSCVFGQVYENSPNSKAATDVREVPPWLTGGPTPQSISTLRFDPEVLRTVTPRQRGLYRGAMALILRRSPRDFHKGGPLDGDLILAGQADDHHVFPAAYLNKQRIPERTRDAILNRTLIDRETNIRINARKPSMYLAEIRAQLRTSFSEVLASHLLPGAPDAANPLLRDDFEGFLSARLEEFQHEIQKATGSTLRDAILIAPEWTDAKPTEDEDEADEDSDEDTAAAEADQLWRSDGKKWHLEHRCSPPVAKRLESLIELLNQNAGPFSVSWNQRSYINLYLGDTIWAEIHTKAHQLILAIWTLSEALAKANLATKLGVKTFETNMTLADKIALPSSLQVKLGRDGYWRIRIRIKDDMDIGAPALSEFMRDWRATLP